MTDFVSGLRADLIEAALREERAATRTRRRLVLGARPALALAAALIALAVLGVLLARVPQQAQPARLKVVEQVRIGGTPQDATLAGGGLWVLDPAGRLVREGRGRLTVRTPTGGLVIAGAGRTVWALGQRGDDRLWLLRADASTGGRVVSRVLHSVPLGLAVGETGLWVSGRPAMTGRVTGSPAVVRLPAPGYIAAGGGTVWALGDEGTVTAVDERSAHVVLRLPQLVQPIGSPGSGGHLLAADAGGVWVGDPQHDEVLRVTRGGVQRRLHVGPQPGPIAVHGDTLWVATGDSLREDFQLKRLDLRTGEVRGGMALGTRAPEALAPFAGGCWVVAADGTALKVVAG